MESGCTDLRSEIVDRLVVANGAIVGVPKKGRLI